jgi:hypothetical protein
MNAAMAQAITQSQVIVSHPISHSLQLLGHSVILGIMLMGITIWVAGRVRDIPTNSDPKEDPVLTPGELVTHSSNVLFLCFGMTGVMILVSDNLARAFAIGAAIALVRFRIRVDQKGLSSSLLFGVLTGMACGVDRVWIAWATTVSFGLLNIFVVGLARHVANERTAHHRPRLQEPTPIL